MIINKLKKIFKRKVDWLNLRSVKPISQVYGLDRGTPIDRYYIDNFLSENKKFIKGTVLEIAENKYSKKFGSGVKNFEILFVNDSNKKATIIGDLTNTKTLPENKIDCFICTQTLNFIYDYKKAIKGIKHLLKPNGIALITVSGIAQISRYDMDKWRDYWRFTTKSAHDIFAEGFEDENIKVDFYGNVLSTVAFLEGISKEELTNDELNYKDENYQMLITIIVKK